MKVTGRSCLEQGIAWNSLMEWIFRAEDAAKAKNMPRTKELLKAAKASADGMKKIFPPVRPLVSKVSRMIGGASGRLAKPGITDELREIRYVALDIYPESKKSCQNGESQRRRGRDARKRG